MNSIENPLNIKNLNLLELAKKPIELCKEYEIPHRFIDGILEIKEGRKKKFILDGKEYARVEILAKEYYETLGYKASWNEGLSFLIVNKCLFSMIFEELKELFEPNYKNKIVKIESIDEFWREAGSKLRSELHSFYVAINYPSMMEYLLNNDQIYIIPKISISDLLKKVEEMNNKNYKELNIDFLRKTMLEKIEEEKKRCHLNPSAMKMVDITHNEYVLDFTHEMVQSVSFEEFNKYSHSAIYSFDLTVLDVINKKLKIVEVKNKDSFTKYQVFSLDCYLSDKYADQGIDLELCFINTSS